MAMVKEIMGQCMVEAFCSDVSGLMSSHPKRFCTRRHRTVSVLIPTFSELKTMLTQSAPQTPFMKLEESSNANRDLALNPMPLTITGTVTIKNSEITDTKEMMMGMMLQNFDSLSNAVDERGIVMQLISTEIDPSKHYL